MAPTGSVPRGGRRALFVDRDGTLNPDLHYLREPERLELYRGVGEGLAAAGRHGYLVLCVTNQSGVERGFYRAEDVEGIHERLNERLRPYGATVDGFYYCPHAPERGCDCRKPGIGLFERAAREWGVDFPTSAVVGDRGLDIVAGHRLGTLTALVWVAGHEPAIRAELDELRVVPDLSADSFRAAVYRILARG